MHDCQVDIWFTRADQQVVGPTTTRFAVMRGLYLRRVCVRGSGTPLRQFIFNKDLGALTVWVMRDYDSVEPIILR